MAIAIINNNENEYQAVIFNKTDKDPHRFRVYSCHDGWPDTYFIEHVFPYWGDRAYETFTNDGDPIFGDLGASHDH